MELEGCLAAEVNAMDIRRGRAIEGLPADFGTVIIELYNDSDQNRRMHCTECLVSYNFVITYDWLK